MKILFREVKEFCLNNKTAITAYTVFFIILYYCNVFIKNNNTVVSIILALLRGFCLILGRIIFQRYYLKKMLKEYTFIKYNNYFNIIFQINKIYLKYLMFFSLMIFVSFIPFLVIQKTISLIFKNNLIKSTLFIFYITIYAIFYFKLIFIENIVIFTQNSYKVKNIVKLSNDIILTDRKFYIKLYSAYNGLMTIKIMLTIFITKNIIVIRFFDVIYILINIMYLVIVLIKFEENTRNKIFMVQEDINAACLTSGHAD
jgi:hypothetical protein